MFRYFRTHPFSIMALCNLAGDCCYLGFAFAAHGFVSIPKLIGASFAILAHIILLAYGDDQAQHIAHEPGRLARLLLKLRALPGSVQKLTRAKPVGIPFLMLAMNGVGLLIDALALPLSPPAVAQTILGVFIIVGCGCFALADFVKKQKTANQLLKTGPVLLTGCTISSGCLTLATGNPFLITGFCLFTVSNLAGFFTKIDKNEAL